MSVGRCEQCGGQVPNLGRFRADDGRTWERMCGGCKVRISLTPERKRQLQAELQAAFSQCARGQS